MNKYWENETPATITTNKNVLQHYPKAGKLAVARLPWTDDKGVERQGKTVALDIMALVEGDAETMKAARAIFAGIVERIDSRMRAEGMK